MLLGGVLLNGEAKGIVNQRSRGGSVRRAIVGLSWSAHGDSC